MKTNDSFGAKPLVSVVLPSLNVAEYIEETLKSVQNQSFDNIEIICVDAKSSDGTIDIIRKCMKYDKRILLFLSDKRSYGYQVNLGIEKAKGEYIAIVETDDFVEKNFIEVLISYTDRNECDFVKADYYEVSGELKKGYTYKRKYIFYDGSEEYNYIYSNNKFSGIFMRDRYIWNGLYRKSYLLENNIRFNESDGAAYQDVGFFVQTIFAANRFGYVNIPVYNYRVDRFGSSIYNKNSFFIEYAELNWIFNNVFWKEASIIHKNEFRKRVAKDFYGALICTLERNSFIIDKSLEDIWAIFSKMVRSWIDSGYIESLSYDIDTWDNILLASNSLEQFNEKWKQQKTVTSKKESCEETRVIATVKTGNPFFYRHFFGSTERRIVVFGAGKIFSVFITLFQDIYKPSFIIDNKFEIQGTIVDGIPVKSPSVLLDMNSDEIIIIICVKDYEEIITQINQIGNYLYYVFLPKLI